MIFDVNFEFQLKRTRKIEIEENADEKLEKSVRAICMQMGFSKSLQNSKFYLT